jgi:phosphonate transport system ATP-binding protein
MEVAHPPTGPRAASGPRAQPAHPPSAVADDRMALALHRVNVKHGASAHALKDLTLSIEPGERVAVIGPSGAGKTTLLSVLAASLRPASGQVRISGSDPWSIPTTSLRRLRQRLFLAPQQPPLPPRQRVVTAVLAGRLPRWSLVRAVRSLWQPADAALAAGALERFSLGDKLWQRVDRLSGGERQRVSMARLLVSQAAVMLVDEPLSALDPTLADQTLSVLLEAAAERNATIVCSLHQVELALARFPRVIALRDGTVFFDGPPDQLDADMIARLYGNRDAGPPDAAFDDAASAVAATRPSRCF